MGNLGPIFSKMTQLYISWPTGKIFMKCSIMVHNRKTKVMLVNFSWNNPFWCKWAIWVKFGTKSSCFTLRAFFRTLQHDSTVGKKKWSHSIILKNPLFGVMGKLHSILPKIMQHCYSWSPLKIFFNCCGMMEHKRQTKVMLVIFPNLVQFDPKSCNVVFHDPL